MIRQPPAALAAGYNIRTHGPTDWQTVGKWHAWNYFGYVPDNVEFNADGTITINNNFGTATGVNTALATAKSNAGIPNLQSSGVGFGGGAYFECVCRWSPPYSGAVTKWPAFWALPIEQDNSTGIYSLQWPGQTTTPTEYKHTCEWDFMEYDSGATNKYGIAMHDYNGQTGSVTTVNASVGSPVTVPGGTDFSQFHRFGALWIPSTPGVPNSGVAKQYFDDVQIGSTVNWSPNTDATGGVPPVSGSQIFSILDKLHLFVILGNTSRGAQGMQMIVKEVNVWQSTDANNLRF